MTENRFGKTRRDRVAAAYGFRGKMFTRQGFSGCLRCILPWPMTKSHTTPYGTGGHGCFPLCEDCWEDLQTPEKRMPYYSDMIEDWKHHPDGRDMDVVTEEIRTAVFGGK